MNKKVKFFSTVGDAIDARNQRREETRTLQDAHNDGDAALAIRKHRSIRHSHAPLVKLTDQEFQIKYRRCVREGKTARDHRTGAWSTRLGNRASRSQYTNWCMDHASASASTDTASSKFSEFAGASNGKKTRAIRARRSTGRTR